ncbi:MAG: hypothetical protein QME81_08000 [bacterium]|nr:hypothetical protein [bacterium]
MTSIVFDTDIISTFSKIQRLELLEDLFPQSDFCIPPAVQNDLIRAEEAGYVFTDYLWSANLFKVVTCSQDEIELISKLSIERRTLGLGEITSIAVAKHRNWLMVTNDEAAKKECDRQGVRYIDLTVILGSLWRNEILSKEEVSKLIDEIEKKDRVRIKNRKEILNDDRS